MCLGIPGQLIEVKPDGVTGVAKISGVCREVNLSCVLPEEEDISSLIGQWALIHVGFAMSIIDEEEAQKTLAVLKEIGEFQEEMAAMSLSDKEVTR